MIDTTYKQFGMLHNASGSPRRRLEAFLELQAGKNPLSEAEVKRLAEKWPHRYGFMVPYLELTAEIGQLTA